MSIIMRRPECRSTNVQSPWPTLRKCKVNMAHVLDLETRISRSPSSLWPTPSGVRTWPDQLAPTEPELGSESVATGSETAAAYVSDARLTAACSTWYAYL